MLGALLYAHQEMQAVIQAVAELANDAGKPSWQWLPPVENQELKTKIGEQYHDQIAAAYSIEDRQQRYSRLDELRAAAAEELVGGTETENQFTADEVKAGFAKLEKHIVRSNLVSGGARIDGRDNKTVRPIDVQVGVLSKAHGSALFTRGETQALVVTTLGNARDAQIIDALEGERKDNFMLHYNFPAYSVGACGRVGSTSRRETGHGRLARRGVAAVMPDADCFPYTVRVVSEITHQTGSGNLAAGTVGADAKRFGQNTQIR